jgi:hypothetical protein
MTVAKTYITANALLEDSYRLANRVIDSGYRPTHIVGVWRGGAPIGIAVQEMLDYHGIDSDHIAVRTSSYTGIDAQEPVVRVFALGYLIDTLDPEHRLLVVDDVFDSGRSIHALLHELRLRCRHNMPREVRIATVYYKPSRNRTEMTPDYYLHQTEEWLVFPHELRGLSEAEIRANKPGAAIILRDAAETEDEGA